MSYWKQKASVWVTASVLVGGVLSAVILFFLAQVERDITEASLISEEQIFSKAEEQRLRSGR